jgi:hypothetical protein
MDNVVDFNKFKQKKDIEQDLARGRKPLYISHKDGKIYGSADPDKQIDTDFGDRTARIKASLEKINKLMNEMQKLNNNHYTPSPSIIKGASNVERGNSETKLSKDEKRKTIQSYGKF